MSKVVDYWIVDVKSLDRDIYKKYTGLNSGIKQHLRALSMNVEPDRVEVKVPYIPDFNEKEYLDKDIDFLKRMYGFENVKIVDYIKPK